MKIIVSNSFNQPILLLLDPEYYKPLYIEHENLTKHDRSGLKEYYKYYLSLVFLWKKVFYLLKAKNGNNNVNY